MAAPLSPASAALIAQSALAEQKHMICDAVAEHVRNKMAITGRTHFWQEVAKTLQERHGISRGHASIRKEYDGYRAWAIKNYTGKDGDERRYMKNCLRSLRGEKDAGAGADGSVGEEGDGDEEENEEGGEGGEGPSAFHANLALRPAGPAQQQQPPPPAGGNITFSLPVRPKET